MVEVIKAEDSPLPTPSEAKRIAREGVPGLMVLGSDGRYHTAPGDPEENARMERWMRLRGLELMATVPFPPTVAVDAIPAYQHKNVSEWLAASCPSSINSTNSGANTMRNPVMRALREAVRAEISTPWKSLAMPVRATSPGSSAPCILTMCCPSAPVWPKTP